jgi:hypothetical protein
LKVTIPQNDNVENLEVEIKTNLVDHHHCDGILYKQYFKDEADAIEDANESKIEQSSAKNKKS